MNTDNNTPEQHDNDSSQSVSEVMAIDYLQQTFPGVSAHDEQGGNIIDSFLVGWAACDEYREDTQEKPSAKLVVPKEFAMKFFDEENEDFFPLIGWEDWLRCMNSYTRVACASIAQSLPKGKYPLYELVPVDSELPTECDTYFVHTTIPGYVDSDSIDLSVFADGKFYFPEDSWEVATHWLRPVSSQPVHPDRPEYLLNPDLHPLSVSLLQRFMVALSDKMVKSQDKYGWLDHWKYDDWKEDCQKGLLDHLAKGDPKDVAIYAAFMWHHSWSTIAIQPDKEKEALIEERNNLIEALKAVDRWAYLDGLESPSEKHKYLRHIKSISVKALKPYQSDKS